MSYTTFLSLALLMPPTPESSDGPRAAEAPSQVERGPAADGAAADKPLAPDELRAAYQVVIRASAKRQKPDPAQVVPQLVAVYVALRDVDGIAQTEIARMRSALRGRMVQLRDRLLREKRLAQKTSPADRRTSPADLRQTPIRGTGQQTSDATSQVADSTRSVPSDQLAGGGEQANANELIELIQMTIEPEHWDVNGGPGSIYFFPMLHALVIRARGDVHDEIGGVLKQVRRINR